MCSVLVPCFDVIVIYSCLSYTSVVLYLSVSADLTLTSVILHSIPPNHVLYSVHNDTVVSLLSANSPSFSFKSCNKSLNKEYTCKYMHLIYIQPFLNVSLAS